MSAGVASFIIRFALLCFALPSMLCRVYTSKVKRKEKEKSEVARGRAMSSDFIRTCERKLRARGGAFGRLETVGIHGRSEPVTR